MPLVPWSERDKRSPRPRRRFTYRGRCPNIPGAIVMVMLPPSLNIWTSGQPLSIVLGGTDYDELAEWRDRILARVRAGESAASSACAPTTSRRSPRSRCLVDRNRAADLGVSLTEVGRTLETMLGSRIVTTFVERGEEYNVHAAGDGPRTGRRHPTCEISTCVHEPPGSWYRWPTSSDSSETSGPKELRRFDRLRSIGLTAALATRLLAR